MPDAPRNLDHVHVQGRARDERYAAKSSGGRRRIRPVSRTEHGRMLLHQVDDAFEASLAERQVSDLRPSSRDTGTMLTVEGGSADEGFPLEIERLERRAGAAESKWQLRSVQPATQERPERAAVWVADRHQQDFRKVFHDYRETDTSKGRPRNEDLVANISHMRTAVLDDLWQSPGDPPKHERCWWELWLDPEERGLHVLRSWAQERGFRMRSHVLVLDSRIVTWLEAHWQQLGLLLHAAVPVAEIRRPSFIDSIEDLSRDEQNEYALELADRVVPADQTAPAVCLLDSGVARNHVLLEKSLAEDDLRTVLGESGFDVQQHGTLLAGLSLYGPMDEALLHSRSVELRHRLESVRILPAKYEQANAPENYGTVTAQGAALPEVSSLRRRVFCLANSTEPGRPGEPTLWSAIVDALASGAEVTRTDDHQLQILSPPAAETSRLFVVAAGNIHPRDIHELRGNYLDVCDSSPIQDPAQAWNALTVGAYTELSDPPTVPDYDGWAVLAPPGQLSPHSRTSVFFDRRWPIKPDICLEGGNVIRESTGLPETCHPSMSLRTTGTRSDTALASANATSAAAAQAARLSALAMERYPDYWPETIRGLLVHAAEWTPAMRDDLERQERKTAKAALLRRFGWGVPSEETVLYSSQRAVTLVIQDAFVPFEGNQYAMQRFRLHDLPWPKEALAEIDTGTVELSATLSYFVEPAASSRGWRGRYGYSSHGLRFDLRAGTETDEQFLSRVGGRSFPGWEIGSRQRDVGSVHKDIWAGSGRELAACDALAVYPVGGWWKRYGRPDRRSLPVRYALLVSLTTATEGVDLYTPIINQLQVPVTVPAT